MTDPDRTDAAATAPEASGDERRRAAPTWVADGSSASSRVTWSRARPTVVGAAPGAPARIGRGRERDPRSEPRTPAPVAQSPAAADRLPGGRSARPTASSTSSTSASCRTVLEEFPSKSAAMAAATIREMIVRGAPAIGQVAAIGLALTAKRTQGPAYARRRRSVAPRTSCATPPDRGQPGLGGRPGHGGATKRSASCRRTVTRSPPRCVRRGR